jgi:squalene cyclase
MDTPDLRHWQNADGGWGFLRGDSATEPTTYALLALSASGRGQTEAAKRGLEWLAASQRKDGGWPPYRVVQQSTWVTALPLLLPKTMPTGFSVRAAQDWILSTQGRESRWYQRILDRLNGAQAETDRVRVGWPFYPDTAAWVAPTAFTILALESASADRATQRRCQLGREFLLSRVCSDAGWNHGSHRTLGYDLPSYPETTGLALLALHKDQGRALGLALAKARIKWSSVHSREAHCWLTIGVHAHGQTAFASSANLRPPRSVIEIALTSLANEALHGNNAFLRSNV